MISVITEFQERLKFESEDGLRFSGIVGATATVRTQRITHMYCNSLSDISQKSFQEGMDFHRLIMYYHIVKLASNLH